MGMSDFLILWIGLLALFILHPELRAEEGASTIRGV